MVNLLAANFCWLLSQPYLFLVLRHSRYLLTCVKTSRLDQDLAIEEDEANFDPDKQIQSYDRFERDLPVFCVSARVYQKLAGRLEKETVNADGFTSLDDTEIPQLQEHARKLTENGRKNTSKLFLADLSQLLTSMRLWSAGNTRAAVSQIGKQQDKEALRVCFGKLDTVSTENPASFSPLMS